ncbi:hypothetical protein [Methylocystis rosea]|uniref:hypothetical protein n=1 Tax=Methylocystis rosea TaxID=173366 RepID=UPI00035D9237|nr:hypothetical protein [Methylocystis rosea]
MLILALDIATYCGFALGRAGEIPASGSVRLKRPGEPADVAAFNMRCFLRDRLMLERPDLICIEHYLNPVAQKSADAVILQLMCFGVAVAEAMARDIRHEKPAASTVRKHFIGAANKGERKATKAAVLNRARALGYIPRDCIDDNRADACAIWDYAAATYARVRPSKLVMFDEIPGAAHPEARQ